MSTFINIDPGDQGLEFLLTVAVGVALLSSAGWLVSRRLISKPAPRHLVLLSALICCLALPVLAGVSSALGLSLVTIRVLPAEHSPAKSTRAPVTPQPRSLLLEQSPDHPKAAVENERPGAGRLDWRGVDPEPPAPSESAALGSAPIANPTNLRLIQLESRFRQSTNPADGFTSLRGLAALAIVVWVSGTLVLLAGVALSYWRMLRVCRVAQPVRVEALARLFDEINRRLGVEVPPQLLSSSQAITPISVGFGRPAVVLPQRLVEAISSDELCDVLVHELAHIQRRDHRVVLLSELAKALYWPIVSVHALNSELERAREDLCDNVVLAGRDALAYGETLLHVAELLVKARPMRAASGIVHWPGKLEERVARLLDPGRSILARTGRGLACAMLAAFIAVGVVASTTRFGTLGNAAERSGNAVDSDVPHKSRSATPDAVDGMPQAAQPAQKPAAATDSDDPRLAGHFAGRVLGPDGKPLAGARMYIARDDPKLKEIGPVRAQTTADGRFAFDAPDMTYSELDSLPARRQGLLIAVADGFAPDWMVTWARTTAHSARTGIPSQGPTSRSISPGTTSQSTGGFSTPQAGRSPAPSTA